LSTPAPLAENRTSTRATGTTARVAVDARDDGLTVSIVDDGLGCDPTTIGSSRGVLNMVDRAGALGGELTVDSAPGTGTRITMVLPHRSAANVGT
jgi:signal transduction histidine kinase